MVSVQKGRKRITNYGCYRLYTRSCEFSGTFNQLCKHSKWVD
jgi:hypothetical protein